MSAPLFRPRSDYTARLLGLGAAAAGAALLYWQFLLPLRHAEAGQPDIRFSTTLVVFGLLWLLLGLSWTAGGLAAATALAARWFLHHHLARLGYPL